MSDKQTKMDSLLGRALRDKDFRQKLIENPAEAAADSELSAEELELVSGGLSLLGGGLIKINPVAYCTEKTCNEGGAFSKLPILSNPGIFKI
jgi:hypothetical protein